MNIAIIGCGDVGRCYAAALSQAGHQITGVCDSNPGRGLEAYANEIGALLHSSSGPWLAQVDLVISAVFGGVALDVARQSLPDMRKGAIYADFTTGNPGDLRASGELAAAAGVKYADVAITGAIGLGGARTPLLCAGDAADELIEIMRAVGAPSRKVGAAAGDAVALKLLRSVFTKGLEALAVECLMAAEQRGLRQELYEVLSDIDQSPIRSFMETVVTTHVRHAGRRLKEVQEARAQLRQDGIQPLALDGVMALFERTSGSIAADPLLEEPTIQNSLDWLFEQQKNNS
ncbi:NAD(P)-dependent oxidoreductase [Paracandidimonas soli]|uniref:3-hydroxyisobutyrate dehydrogenase-like beta-hydroxyacid dehydrogenase n=1 Tax=Paracandidimonas soli TaxID=1917182 RepID=A0A4R3UPG4_9BURK|nr:NAD(P)-binding domain-containing protein [Paracandidimonas soli]TCU92597.1 3-hydroxyisobutyrate dehydrogenase-like beta-hydroxyacid dehydrogenase [Paracandidimonas soli]